jgi:glycosyltransferase involved in cell wall biosynthesis
LYAKRATKEFLKWAEEFNPDMLWLHNLHSYFLNYEMLFEWIKTRPQMEVKWTLHDCWSFTGHCVHFTVVKCYKWKTECKECPQLKEYPASLVFSNCEDTFKRKKQAFTGVKNMTIITPSNWLADLVKQSFLKEYPVEVVHNTIDLNIFKPTPSDFRECYGLENKKIVLGVANEWNEKKGLNDFIKLSGMLDDNYKIVLVGLDEGQLKKLPGNILGIKRTHGQKELAGIYTSADVFVNPSKEETFGLTTLEALSCGTQAIVYKDTACEEVVNKYGGITVEQEIIALLEAIKRETENYFMM